MSDQVVFTKEEVEKIRNAVYVMQKTFEVLKLDTIRQIPQEILSLLDSPRPRPKVSMGSLWECWRVGADFDPGNKLKTIMLDAGFDVED
jgi:hypothetical protein